MSYLIIDTLSKNKSIFNPQTTLENSSSYGIWDLTRASISYRNTAINIDSLFIITEYYQMRPDLIAAIKMGDHGKMGSMLKLNNISNPFAIMEGKIMAIPTGGTVESSYNNKKATNQAEASSNTNTNPNQVFRKNQEQKKFKVSEGRKKFLNSKIKNQPAMVLPPNVAQESDKAVSKSNGFLIFAPDAGGGGFNKPVN
jgi:hypothetical protein